MTRREGNGGEPWVSLCWFIPKIFAQRRSWIGSRMTRRNRVHDDRQSRHSGRAAGEIQNPFLKSTRIKFAAVRKTMKALFASAVVVLTPSLSLAAASEWRPTRNVEVIVGTPAGGPLDATARLIQKYLEPRNAGSAVLVMNKPGGSHVIAMQYLNAHTGDAHYISMALPNLLTNRITGAHPLTYTDVTPLALLTS